VLPSNVIHKIWGECIPLVTSGKGKINYERVVGETKKAGEIHA
jgi:hypothetical protein